MKTSTANRLATGFLIWGFSAMAGHLLGIAPLKGLGLASMAAPYTKVFCQAESLEDGRRFETFAARFTLTYFRSDGSQEALRVTPELYQRLAGPYNRRNAYGAVLAYGPALPEDMRRATFRYALIEPGVIVKELGLPSDAHDFEIHIQSLTAGWKDTWELRAE
ncbi:MAG: hypothetical protein AAF558_00840 [Verrucomicrobiota bacterium]